ncbi:hypothetical protein EGW08_015353 [Elysia chlorotica]|uniref:VWFD domain-containing protein n=1 Tax=Elysia chlorotica TaxID=188477 RepID=A0A433T5R8_ELYCH|nr:hypothetical protein EGW08_015353 [Elysia chlorotica]
MERVSGSSLDRLISPGHQARGLVITADASTGHVTRKAQLDVLWGKVKDGLHNVGMFNLWRSAIQGYDDREWGVFSTMESFYPEKQYESKDIFSVKWQSQLMKELQHLVSMKTHKVANELINRTLLSELEQMNFPAMTRVAAYRVANSLAPQVMYKLMNEVSASGSQINWHKYWEILEPLSSQVEEERKLLIDPIFINRDAILTSYFVKLRDVQRTLMANLDAIDRTSSIVHTELPVMQWVVFAQERVVYMLQEIVTRNAAKKAITKLSYFENQLEQSKTSVAAILTKSHTIMTEVESLSLEKDKDGRDRFISIPGPKRHGAEKVDKQTDVTFDVNDGQVVNTKPQFDRGLTGAPSHEEDAAKISNLNEDDLIQSLHQLSLNQMQVIEDIHQSILDNKTIEIDLFLTLIKPTIDNLDLLDRFWRVQQVHKEAVMEKLLLVTIQNEMAIDLFYQHHALVVNEKRSLIDSDILFNRFHFFVKVQSYYLGQRTAASYKFKMLRDVVMPQLTPYEANIYRGVQNVLRNIDVDVRKFENITMTVALKESEVDALFKSFSHRMDTHISKMRMLQSRMSELEGVPKVYLVSEIMETINYLKHAVELARSATLPSDYDHRLFWIERLDNQATDVQVLLAAMSPIFSKFSSRTEASRPGWADPIPRDRPSDLSLEDVMRLSNKQRGLIEDLHRSLRSEDVSSVIRNFLKRNLPFQSTIREKVPAAVKVVSQKGVPDAVYLVFKDTIKKQREVYQALRAAISSNQDQVQDWSDLTDLVDEQDHELAQMEFEIDHATAVETPDGITGFLNTTWGHKGEKQELKIQMFAKRSLEQIMWIFKQMDAVVRSQDVIRDVNKNLAVEEPAERQTMDALNVYNHLHFVASFGKVAVPEWVKEYSTRLQDYLKMVMWGQYSWQRAEDDMDDTQQLILDVSGLNKKMDMILMNKVETDKFLSVPLPQWLNAFKFNQNSKSLSTHIVSHISQGFLPAKCEVRDNKVKTIDTVQFELQPNVDKCRTLLAMDCSQDKSFAVTIIKSNTDTNGHDVQVVGDNTLVEILPNDLNVQVRVNETEQDLKDNEPLVWRLNAFTKYLVITRSGQKVMVEFPITGLYITVEGAYIKIEISQSFQHKVCGLCGNFDTQKSWEFEGPVREVYTSPISFASSYVLPGTRRCDAIRSRHMKTARAAMEATAQFVPRYHDGPTKKQWSNEPTRQFSRGEDGAELEDQEDGDLGVDADIEVEEEQPGRAIEPEQITDIRERQKRGQVCISQSPVLRCPRPLAKPVRTRLERVAYICLDSSDPEVQRRKEIDPLQLIWDVKGEKMTRPVRQEVECVWTTGAPVQG